MFLSVPSLRLTENLPQSPLMSFALPSFAACHISADISVLSA